MARLRSAMACRVRERVFGQVIRLGVRRIAPRLHVVLEGLHRAGDRSSQIGIPPHELGRRSERQSQQIVIHQHLPVTVGAGADANGGNLDLLGDERRHFARNPFQHHATRAAAFQRQRVMHELLHRRQRLALHFVAAHGVQ